MFFKEITKLFSSPPIQRIGFEDILHIIRCFHSSQYCLINTMPITLQDTLIPNTVAVSLEEAKINEWVDKHDTKIHIIIYGKNATDDTVEKKYTQLRNLGFGNIFIYSGGIFEWCLLQDIYGKKQFVTMGDAGDFLRFKPTSLFAVQRLGY